MLNVTQILIMQKIAFSDALQKLKLHVLAWLCPAQSERNYLVTSLVLSGTMPFEC